MLEADIKGCFDNIDHEWLIEHTPMDKRILRKWLKAGFWKMDASMKHWSEHLKGGSFPPTWPMSRSTAWNRPFLDTSHAGNGKP